MVRTETTWCLSMALSSVLLVACSSKGEDSEPAQTPSTGATAELQPLTAPANTTPNQFYKRGTPTFVTGSAGDAVSDAAIASQVGFTRHLFPGAAVVTDVVSAAAWPTHPVVYGGPHQNARIASAKLPFQVGADKIVIGGQTFEGPQYRLITVVPEVAGSHPEFLLYAGTSSRGVEGINAVHHGGQAILIADEFGPLVAGRWVRGPKGELRAELDAKRARRIDWRSTTRKLGKSSVELRFPAQIAAAPGDEAIIDACVQGVAQASKKLGVEIDEPLTFYVYPDRGSVQTLTGRAYDGFAVTSARVLHVIGVRPAMLVGLAAHEATHVLAYHAWGPTGSMLFGEGLAVWVSGYYGGTSLADWKGKVPQAKAVAPLLGPTIGSMPEGQGYPTAGRFVAALIEALGLERVRDHLYGADRAGWSAACTAAGIDAAKADALLTAATAP